MGNAHVHYAWRQNNTGPIFLQFIDACIQLLQQFPTSFQFNSNLLIFLMDALYSCQFGNFLCDNEKEREEASVQQETTSIWTYVMLNQQEFVNVFYRPNPHVLLPNCSRARMVFWSEYYLRWSSARPQYLVDQQHLVPAGEAYQLFAAPRSPSSSSSSSSSPSPPPSSSAPSIPSPSPSTAAPTTPASVGAQDGEPPLAQELGARPASSQRTPSPPEEEPTNNGDTATTSPPALPTQQN
jgi:myotubularin-related protein 6/7/8